MTSSVTHAASPVSPPRPSRSSHSTVSRSGSAAPSRAASRSSAPGSGSRPGIRPAAPRARPHLVERAEARQRVERVAHGDDQLGLVERVLVVAVVRVDRDAVGLLSREARTRLLGRRVRLQRERLGGGQELQQERQAGPASASRAPSACRAPRRSTRRGRMADGCRVDDRAGDPRARRARARPRAHPRARHRGTPRSRPWTPRRSRAGCCRSQKHLRWSLPGLWVQTTNGFVARCPA